LAIALILGAALHAPACGGDSVNVAALCPTTPKRLDTTRSMTAAEFCPLYLQSCKGADNPSGGYTSESQCEAGYNGLMFENTRECRSYHLCNSAAYDPKNALLHCLHTMGVMLCADTATGS
jgi:hypothetical protein